MDSEDILEQRMRDNAPSMYRVLEFCRDHLSETKWASPEARLEGLDIALKLCEVVLDQVEGRFDG